MFSSFKLGDFNETLEVSYYDLSYSLVFYLLLSDYLDYLELVWGLD
jgi:hypothetical protein